MTHGEGFEQSRWVQLLSELPEIGLGLSTKLGGEEWRWMGRSWAGTRVAVSNAISSAGETTGVWIVSIPIGQHPDNLPLKYL